VSVPKSEPSADSVAGRASGPGAGERLQGTAAERLERLAVRLYRFRDTCWVYMLRDGDSAVLVDFGNGDVMDALPHLGIVRVSDVLMTHHHRDQGQGLARAVAAGARVWVPATEQELFRGVDSHWQARELDNSYNNRQDRFSLLEPVPISGTLDDYREYRFGGFDLTVIPTPGHTTGSVTLLAQLDGRRVAFTGDLIAGPGKLWSLAATQWSYNGAEGVAATLASLLDLKERAIDLLLPSHGEPMAEPAPAIDLLCERLWQLLRQRKQNPRLLELRERPFEVLSPHLLCNRTALAYHYVLLSESGEALFIDFGYDFMVGTAAGSDRASRRPWLYTLAQLRRQFGVKRVEVVVPTHFHDDHVAGINLLRQAEGSEVWAAESFADVLSDPWRFDLPCLWYDPVPVDRRLPLEVPIRWREFELTLHHQAGHTRYAVAISFQVDGRKVLAVGDQYEGGPEGRWNYVYNNGFHRDDYRGGAALLERLRPDLLLAGHYLPHEVDDEFIAGVSSRAELLAAIHEELLPVEQLDFGGGDRAVTLRPYRAAVPPGRRLLLTAEVANPFERSETAEVALVAPPGWRVEPERRRLTLEPKGRGAAEFTVIASGPGVRRARVAADLTIGQLRLGQQAEALVTVERSVEQTVARPEERSAGGPARAAEEARAAIGDGERPDAGPEEATSARPGEHAVERGE
jgi:glyoxylase-like metal-dependent hydrolase (beta-lactamase superfamily II)